MKIKGSFGMVMLLVVMAVVLVLVARAWAQLAAPAIEVTQDGLAVGVSAHGQTDAAAAIRHDRPDLKQTQATTDDHTEAVGEALSAIK